MKANLKNLPVILLLASAIIMMMTSCKKDNNTSTPPSTGNSFAANMTAKGANADNAYDDVFSVALQTGNEKNLDIMAQSPGKSATTGEGIPGSYYCASLTVSGSSFPVTLT